MNTAAKARLSLTPAERRAKRALAHSLEPVVSVGQHGLTPAVLREINVALKAHELVKIRVHSDDRQARNAWMAEICEAAGCAPVQHLGKVLIVYRPRPKEAAESTARPPRGRPAAPGERRQVADGKPAPRARGTAAPRSGGKPAPRSGGMAAPRSGGNPAPRSGGNPAPRSGGMAGPRSGGNPAPRPGSTDGGFGEPPRSRRRLGGPKPAAAPGYLSRRGAGRMIAAGAEAAPPPKRRRARS